MPRQPGVVRNPCQWCVNHGFTVEFSFKHQSMCKFFKCTCPRCHNPHRPSPKRARKWQSRISSPPPSLCHFCEHHGLKIYSNGQHEKFCKYRNCACVPCSKARGTKYCVYCEFHNIDQLAAGEHSSLCKYRKECTCDLEPHMNVCQYRKDCKCDPCSNERRKERNAAAALPNKITDLTTGPKQNPKVASGAPSVDNPQEIESNGRQGKTGRRRRSSSSSPPPSPPSKQPKLASGNEALPLCPFCLNHNWEFPLKKHHRDYCLHMHCECDNCQELRKKGASCDTTQPKDCDVASGGASCDVTPTGPSNTSDVPSAVISAPGQQPSSGFKTSASCSSDSQAQISSGDDVQAETLSAVDKESSVLLGKDSQTTELHPCNAQLETCEAVKSENRSLELASVSCGSPSLDPKAESEDESRTDTASRDSDARGNVIIEGDESFIVLDAVDNVDDVSYQSVSDEPQIEVEGQSFIVIDALSTSNTEEVGLPLPVSSEKSDSPLQTDEKSSEEVALSPLIEETPMNVSQSEEKSPEEALPPLPERTEDGKDPLQADGKSTEEVALSPQPVEKAKNVSQLEEKSSEETLSPLPGRSEDGKGPSQADGKSAEEVALSPLPVEEAENVSQLEEKSSEETLPPLPGRHEDGKDSSQADGKSSEEVAPSSLREEKAKNVSESEEKSPEETLPPLPERSADGQGPSQTDGKASEEMALSSLPEEIAKNVSQSEEKTSEEALPTLPERSEDGKDPSQTDENISEEADSSPLPETEVRNVSQLEEESSREAHSPPPSKKQKGGGIGSVEESEPVRSVAVQSPSLAANDSVRAEEQVELEPACTAQSALKLASGEDGKTTTSDMKKPCAVVAPKPRLLLGRALTEKGMEKVTSCSHSSGGISDDGFSVSGVDASPNHIDVELDQMSPQGSSKDDNSNDGSAQSHGNVVTEQKDPVCETAVLNEEYFNSGGVAGKAGGDQMPAASAKECLSVSLVVPEKSSQSDNVSTQSSTNLSGIKAKPDISILVAELASLGQNYQKAVPCTRSSSVEEYSTMSLDFREKNLLRRSSSVASAAPTALPTSSAISSEESAETLSARSNVLDGSVLCEVCGERLSGLDHFRLHRNLSHIDVNQVMRRQKSCPAPVPVESNRRSQQVSSVETTRSENGQGVSGSEEAEKVGLGTRNEDVGSIVVDGSDCSEKPKEEKVESVAQVEESLVCHLCGVALPSAMQFRLHAYLKHDVDTESSGELIHCRICSFEGSNEMSTHDHESIAHMGLIGLDRLLFIFSSIQHVIGSSAATSLLPTVPK